MPFRIALSGLNAASSELRVVGNNVANASTTGFKKSRTEFADIYSVASLGNVGQAIGSGVAVASVAQQFSQGNISFTDNGLDLAVSGQGFFRLSDQGAVVYSRAGAFGVDRDGYIVNAQDQRLTAYLADSAGNITGAVGDLRLDTSDIAPRASTLVEVGVNLDATSSTPPAFNVNDPTTYNSSTSLTVYDSLGTAHLATTYFRKTATANEWETHLFIDGTEATPTTSGTLTFNADGTLASPAGGSVAYDAFSIAGADDLSLTLDYQTNTPTTQFGSQFGVNFLSQDGYTTGRLSGVDISESGVVLARFTNGQSRTLGQVALANFANAQGLRQLGDTSWAESFESGSPLVGPPGTASLGLIQSGALEGSNVDLTEQLVTMITAQRNFQANAQVITTADTVTQTIINIRR
ncbi:MAG TPA: flagellar hook protein FlgE [Gammaproteobacteria bacterium]|nr:flagellar hook protein FlgE [Gammaproteobacteria bacterium]